MNTYTSKPTSSAAVRTQGSIFQRRTLISRYALALGRVVTTSPQTAVAVTTATKFHGVTQTLAKRVLWRGLLQQDARRFLEVVERVAVRMSSLAQRTRLWKGHLLVAPHRIQCTLAGQHSS